MLSAASTALKEFFLMKRDNTNYPLNFNKNHVTGIFFQGKVHLTTWFGPKREYIQGIQMLPLSPAVYLSRSQDFAIEEWEDQLESFYGAMPITDKWKSLLTTGNLAFHQPAQALEILNRTDRLSGFDDGLTKIWAMYWTATVCTSNCDKVTTQAPTPAPTPTPTCAPGAPAPTCSPGVTFCNGGLGQLCPDGPCPDCGTDSCDCCANPCTPPDGPAPGPSPPGGQCGVTFCNPTEGQLCPGDPPFACPQCGGNACDCCGQ